MIPFQTLLETMEKFNSKLKETEDKCDAPTKGGEEHMHWYKNVQSLLKVTKHSRNGITPFCGIIFIVPNGLAMMRFNAL